jgi:glycine/D-amino acid oxidase-like deaminating enzyme
LNVVVVGAGIVGLSVAWQLARRGAHVTMIDRDAPGSGCSAGNSACISAGSVAPLAMPGVIRSAPAMLLDPAGPLHIPARYWLKAAPWLLRFTAASRPAQVERIAAALASLLHPAVERHREMLRDLGDEGMLREHGQLFVYRDERQRDKDRAVWDLRRRHGARFEYLDRAAIDRLEPAVGPDYALGVLSTDGAMIANPLRHCQQIAAALAGRGVTILRDGVAAIEREEAGVSGVRCESGTRHAGAVVLCAGAWSHELLRPLGYRVPLETQRGYHLTYSAAGVEIGRPVIPADRKVFITPQESGLRVGGTVELAGLEAPPDARRAELLVDDLRAVFPQARLDGPRSAWMGHRPCLPDSLPVLGACPRHPGLWLAFGHGHLGLTGSAPTADFIASAMYGEAPAIDPRPFSISRFD